MAFKEVRTFWIHKLHTCKWIVLVSHCPSGNNRFCLRSYQGCRVCSGPKPEQNVQQGSCCCSTFFMSPTCLQGLRVSVNQLPHLGQTKFKQQPDDFGWLTWTRQRTHDHLQQIEMLRLKMLRAQLTPASSSFTCSDTDNSICFLWTAGGRFDSTNWIHHLLFLRLYCTPVCTTWTTNNPQFRSEQHNWNRRKTKLS